MSERRPSPESKNALAHPTWDRILRVYKELQRHASETSETSKELWKHDEVRRGSEAAVRSAINIFISCADIVPGVGELASWGADILKIYENSRHKKKQAEAVLRGEDPTKVPREKFNLTPDVHILTATISEALELLAFFTAPTHAIETVNQLWYDVPRIRDGVRKARAVLSDVQRRRADAREAAKHFRAAVDTPDEE